MKVRKLKTIDLFSGCGGLTDGFESTGLFSTIAVVDWNLPSLKTLINRLKEKWGRDNAQLLALHFDMQKTKDLLNGWNNDSIYGTHEGLKSIVKKEKSEVDVIVGGPPCQAYSIAGRIRDKNGMRNDYRNYLFETYIEVVNSFRPKAFVFENVLGMLSAKPNGTPITDLIRQAFSNIGYSIVDDFKKYAVVDATDYGIPQYRKRLIIVGLRNDTLRENPEKIFAEFYNKILPSYKAKKRTVKDAILDLPKMKVINKPKQSHEILENATIPNHYPRYHNIRDIEIFKELALDLYRKKRKYETIKSLKSLYTKKTGKVSNVHKYHVLDPNQPSNTIVAHLYKDGLRHIHPDPEQARSITVREAARLQSFSDDFEFFGSMGEQYKMVGNAVPPKLAEKIAFSLYELLNKYKING